MAGLAINPWIGADDSALWKLELCNLGLHSFIFQCILLDHQNFCIVSVSMLIGAETNVGLNGLSGEIDNRFMEFVLQDVSAAVCVFERVHKTYRVPQVVCHESLSVNVGQGSAPVLGIEIRYKVLLLWFFESDGLEKNIDI